MPYVRKIHVHRAHGQGRVEGGNDKSCARYVVEVWSLSAHVQGKTCMQTESSLLLLFLSVRSITDLFATTSVALRAHRQQAGGAGVEHCTQHSPSRSVGGHHRKDKESVIR